MCKFNFFQNSYEIDIIKIKYDKKTNYIEPCLACPKGLVQDAILALKQYWYWNIYYNKSYVN